MRRKARLVRGLTAIPAVSLLALGWAYLGPLGWPKPFNQAVFDRLVADIRSGVLKPDGQGVVTLSRDRAALSATGSAYVRRTAKGGLVVFIPAWVGRSSLLISPIDWSGDNWLEGYVYRIGPDENGDVLGPPGEPFWRAVNDNCTQVWILWTDRQLSEHWEYAYPFS